jgi:hypothetical protein
MRVVIDDLIVEVDPPPNRIGKCDGGRERHFTEAAVMLAYAFHLFETTIPDLCAVELHPDGEHGKRFEIAKWLAAHGFPLKESRGVTNYCGKYVCGERQILISATPGLGDVVAVTPGGAIIAECKGGIINTRHSGQLSRLRKGLCEAVGLLMSKARGGRQVAVVPYTETTLRIAKQMASRADEAGIAIALVRESGEVLDVAP